MGQIDPASDPLGGVSQPHQDRPPRFEVDATVVEQRRIIGHEFEIIFDAPAIRPRSSLTGETAIETSISRPSFVFLTVSR